MHPRAGQVLTGAEIIVQVLADEGVEHHLRLQRRRDPADVRRGIPLQRGAVAAANGGEPMPLIVPANEQGAGFMAAGYARASGKVGVCLVTSGPGATNTVTPVRDCMADSVPIVVICGQVPHGGHRHRCVPGSAGRQHHGRGREARAFSSPIRHELEATMRTAFEIARTGRPGPVVIDVPKDVQNWQGVVPGQPAPADPRLSPAHGRSCATGTSIDEHAAPVLRRCSAKRSVR